MRDFIQWIYEVDSALVVFFAVISTVAALCVWLAVVIYLESWTLFLAPFAIGWFLLWRKYQQERNDDA